VVTTSEATSCARLS